MYLGTKPRSSIAPGGSVGRRSTISYDAKAAIPAPPVMDPARYINPIQITQNV